MTRALSLVGLAATVVCLTAVVSPAQQSTTMETKGFDRSFSQSDVDKRGVKIVRDGVPAQLSDFREGDRLSATIITSMPPHILTQREVQATVVAAAAAPVAARAPSAPAAPAAARTTPPAPAAAPAPQRTPAPAAPAQAPAETRTLPKTRRLLR